MATRPHGNFEKFKDEGSLIASFGEAQLIKYLDGNYELRGGSEEDRLAAKQRISLFCNHVQVRGV